MKTLVTAIQKGGQGKTFVTCHLAFYFQEQGLRVAVLDFDTQGNASFTLSSFSGSFSAFDLFQKESSELRSFLETRQKTNEITKQNKKNQGDLFVFEADNALTKLDRINPDEARKKLTDARVILSDFFDVCLIDTPPSLGVPMVSSVLIADFILSPVEPEAYSLHGMKKMVSVISHLRTLNPRVVFLGMLPNKVDTRKPRHMETIKLLIEAWPSLVFPLFIGVRDSIAQALGDRVPVWTLRKTAARKAASEVKAMAHYVGEKMGLSFPSVCSKRDIKGKQKNGACVSKERHPFVKETEPL